MISWCDECALKQIRALIRRLFPQCCDGAVMAIVTPVSSGNFSFISSWWGKVSPSAATTTDWGMQLCWQSKQRGQTALLWLPWTALSLSEDLCFQFWHTGDWQAAQCPALWLVATGRKERCYLKQWFATQFLWTGRTVPSVSGQRDKSSSEL